MASLLALLPQHPGLLPQWLLFVSIVSVANSIQAYLTTSYTAQVYLGPATSPRQGPNSSSSAKAYPLSNSPVTPLSSRTFGTWTLVQSLVRLYAAYNITSRPCYELAILTYGVAWAHFTSEWLLFGSARWGRGLAGPVAVSTGSLVWMGWAYGGYVL